MVRLEQDLADGERSADVIGHPHCWGKHGPMTIPCSVETRENDRPRVIMEMAVQLWPLQGEDWHLQEKSEEVAEGKRLDTLEALYTPLNSRAVLRFHKDTKLLHSISIDGVKGGELGTHTHAYSNFVERCGAMMPDHNVKSFDGRVWVEEDVLQLECTPVEEALFVRPAQVKEGYFDVRQEEGQVVACIDGAETRDDLMIATEDVGVELLGGWQEHVLNSEQSQHCVAVVADDEGLIGSLRIKRMPASKYLSVYSPNFSQGSIAGLVDILRAEAKARGYEMQSPVRVMIFDNDGMGQTGESVAQVSVAIAKE